MIKNLINSFRASRYTTKLPA